MRNYPRKIRRIIFKAKTGGLRRSGYYRATKRARSRSIFRRFIRRRAIRPELKWNEVTQAATTFSQNAPYTSNLTPTTINTGSGTGNREGNQLNFVKVDLQFEVESLMGITGTLNNNSTYVRVVLWSCRTDYTQTLAYMNNGPLSRILENLDFNMVTVHRDWHIRLGNTQLSNAPTVQGASGGANRKYGKASIAFPRKVKFASFGSLQTLVDEEKYSLYITCYGEGVNADGGYRIAFAAKTWYFDA